MKLKLTRPLCVIDLETTGIEKKTDRIVEISVIKIFPDGTRESKESKINPTIPIPKGASDVHGITDEMVKDEPTFKEVAQDLANYIKDCDVCGFNSNWFDLPLLQHEFERVGIWNALDHAVRLDVQSVYRNFNQRRLIDAYKQYTGKELEGAHASGNDTAATYELLEALLEKHPELQKMDLVNLSEVGQTGKQADIHGHFRYREDGEIIFAFGKNANAVAKNDKSYLQWMLNTDFPISTKNFIKDKILCD